MKVQIQDPENELDRNFGLWLITRIKAHFNAELDPRKLANWDKYFETSEDFKHVSRSPIRSEVFLRDGINSFLVKKIPGVLELYINKNKFVTGLDRVSVDTLCRLITFGNREVPGYPVILTTLQHFVDNIDEYIQIYEEGIE